MKRPLSSISVAVAIVHLVSDQIGQAHLTSPHFRKWQGKPALPLIAGVIDNHGISAASLPDQAKATKPSELQLPGQAAWGWIWDQLPSRKAVLVFKTCSSLV